MSEYSYRRCGTTGCEINDPDGLVIAWTVDPAWAALIVGFLNRAEGNGLRPAPWHHHDGAFIPIRRTFLRRVWANV